MESSDSVESPTLNLTNFDPNLVSRFLHLVALLNRGCVRLEVAKESN